MLEQFLFPCRCEPPETGQQFLFVQGQIHKSNLLAVLDSYIMNCPREAIEEIQGGVHPARTGKYSQYMCRLKTEVALLPAFLLDTPWRNAYHETVVLRAYSSAG